MTLAAVKEKFRLGMDLVWSVSQVPAWFTMPYDAPLSARVPDDFIGVNVATSAQESCDDYVIDKLQEADIRHVRLAWGANSPGSYTERFLQRLLAEEFDVMVALVPDPSIADRIDRSADAQQQWRQFAENFLHTYGHRVAVIEIGNTPNRPRWSGYTPAAYLQAWRIAAQAASGLNLELAGPNISDFEPFFNAAYMRGMRRIHAAPHIHTDNLFVERAVQPEAYDPSALGKLLAKAARLNLVKKINILADIGRKSGAAGTYCTYTCWTHRRLARWTTVPQQKGADYLARYMIISAVTGKLDRLYWGPLIDGRDGLIDCGNKGYPEVDNVTHYAKVRGRVEDFDVTQSFHAFKFISNLIKGSECVQALCGIEGLCHFIFVDQDNEHHILWAPDRWTFDLYTLYPQDYEDALPRSVCGGVLQDETAQRHIRETPMVLTWPRSAAPFRPTPHAIRNLAPLGPKGTVYGLNNSWKPVDFGLSDWRGVANIKRHGNDKQADALAPDPISSLPVGKILRDKRNKLWTVNNPNGNGGLVVKLNRAIGAKRISYLFKDSKGKRHWNNATEMLRRGVNTPQPIAYAERSANPGVADNYYISEYLEDAFSTRDLFTAFALGEQSFRGISKEEWLTLVAGFVANMHMRHVIHRDLSSGNLLITLDGGTPKIYAIDIGRAHIDKSYNRNTDLNRICYKLDWPDREFFVAAYQAAFPNKPLRLWRASLRSYDAKQYLKKRIKGQPVPLPAWA